MTQILNILRKDVRHLKLEILASLAILLLFNLIVPRTWTELFGAASNAEQGAAFLVIVSWAILILRLVHAERLSGLNQFWTTRPYEWPKLLAAKALFLVLFVYTPFLLAHMYLLHHAGLSIPSSLGPILHNLLLFTCIAILPMVCIAMVTTSFNQAVFSALAILVALLGLQSAYTYFASTSATLALPRHAPLFLLPLEVAIVLLFLGVAVLLQYSRRATRQSIAVVAGGAIVLLFTSLLIKGSDAAASGYATMPDAPASVTIDTSTHQSFSSGLPKNPRTAMYAIPLRYADYAPGADLSPEAQRYTLTAADGYTWTSDWLDYYTGFDFLKPKNSETSAHTRAFIDIPWAIVPRVVGRPVSIRIEFLFNLLASNAPYTYSLPSDPHAVPGLGVCALDDNQDSIYCRASYGDFGYVTVSTAGSTTPCDASPDTAPVPATPLPATGFLNGPRRQPGSPLPAITPVAVNLLYLISPGRPSRIHTCPGTPITFVVRHVQRRIYLATPPATITLNAPAPGGRVGP